MDKQRMEEKAKAHAQEYCGHANEYHKTACELDFKVGYQVGYADAEQRVEVLREALMLAKCGCIMGVSTLCYRCEALKAENEVQK